MAGRPLAVWQAARRARGFCRVCENKRGGHHDLCDAHVEIERLREESLKMYQHGFQEGARAVAGELRKLAEGHMTNVPKHLLVQLAMDWEDWSK